ncbi:EEF1A lysine methyltransferase 1-like [Amphiura filiformis]|uniref:EEF1A lysine methyltransferase 1-like n=1 Tax=Amphiura filiformis TaxID=82378 RepID=UPI003B213181
MSDSDDDAPQLSAHALAALQEFYAEQSEKVNEEQQAMEDGQASKTGIIQEDWQLSQFWYDEQTSEVLAKEVLAAAGENGRIACVSCPTLYQKLQTMKPASCKATVFEFDHRFATYKEDFVFYDYNKPLELPKEIESQSYDVVVADPPFLNEECLAKTAETVKYLTKGKVILCTGAVMETQAKELLDASVCLFIPSHTNKLGNEFRCYANYQTQYLCHPR